MVEHSQCKSNRNGQRNDVAKVTKKVACLELRLACDTDQPNLTTSKAVATTVADNLAMNQALSSFLATIQMLDICNMALQPIPVQILLFIKQGPDHLQD